MTPAIGYDLVRGSLGILSSSGGDFGAAADGCQGNELVTTTRDDPATPVVDSGFWYLVRAVNCASTGTYDSGASSQQGSRDLEIVSAAASCP